MEVVRHARAMSSIIQVVQNNKRLAYYDPAYTVNIWNGQIFNSGAEESQ